MRAICGACQAGTLDATPVLAISNNQDASALAWAQENGVDALHLSAKKLGSPEALDNMMLTTLKKSDVTHIVLSGYMRKLGPRTLGAYENRILNVHPSLLPAFGGKGMYGDNVHEAVLAAKVRESGATIHFVTADYDEGPILAQKKCPIQNGDTIASLKARIAPIEAALYIETLQKLVGHAANE
jgi:phosphoribosylglycinamide formyltransferase 1